MNSTINLEDFSFSLVCLFYLFRNMQRKGRKGRDLRKRPIIIFDLLSFMYIFLGGTVGMLGGQHQISLQMITTFLQKLKDSGADLVFFCDGQCQKSKTEEWCSRRNQKYAQRKESMEKGWANKDDQFKCNPFLASVIKTIQDKKFGKVNVSTEVECDRAIVKYALDNKREVLALVTDDTDMLIFEGDFQLWQIDFENITDFGVKSLDRNALGRHLELSREQMKFFATIKGNDFTKRYFKEMICKEATDVASIVRENFTSSYYELDHHLFEKVAKAMVGAENIRTEHLESVEESLRFYKLDFELEQFDPKINVLMNCLEMGYPLQYDVDFMDFKQRCNEKYINIILKTLERACEILQQDQPHNQHLNELIVITKTDVKREYEIHRMRPSVENDKQSENDIKWRHLLYILGLQLTVAEVKEVAQRSDVGIVVTFLAILFLRQVISN